MGPASRTRVPLAAAARGDRGAARPDRGAARTGRDRGTARPDRGVPRILSRDYGEAGVGPVGVHVDGGVRVGPRRRRGRDDVDVDDALRRDAADPAYDFAVVRKD